MKKRMKVFDINSLDDLNRVNEYIISSKFDMDDNDKTALSNLDWILRQCNKENYNIKGLKVKII
jgi:hypothetical protein